MSVDPVSLGLTFGTMALQYGLNASRRIDGPRLQELAVSTADYGTPVLNFHGTRLIDACPIIWAEKRKEVIQRRKTKGGKTSNAIYFGTWAVLVAGHPSDAVLQILFNKQLVYDATGAGPVTPFAIGYSTVGKSGRPRERTINLADHMRIYYGAEDQLPDPRMQATVDAEFGDGSTPAYRGVTIIVFEDVPLEKFGNQVPTVGVLATRTADPAYPWETKTVTVGNGRLWNTAFSPDGTRLLWISNSGPLFELWDVPTRTRIRAGSIGTTVNIAQIGTFNDGSFVAIGGGNDVAHFFSADGVLQSSLSLSSDQEGVVTLSDGNNTEHWLTLPYSFLRKFFLDGAEVDPDDTGEFFTVAGYCRDAYGDIWAIARLIGPFVDATEMFLYRVVDTGARPGIGGLHSIAMPGGGPEADVGIAHSGAGAHFVCQWNGTLYAIDDETFTIKDSAAFSPDTWNVAKQWQNCPPGAESIWFNATEISLTDLSVIQTVDLNDWKAEDADGILYSAVLDALFCWPQFATSNMTIRYLNRVGSTAVTFATIAADIAEQCGLDSGDHDFSALTDPVRGYSWTQGSGKDVLDPLRELFDVDFRPHDFVLQGLARGGASGGTIASTDFARLDRDDPAFSAPTDGGTDLPRLLRMTFADADADQQVNATLAPRLSGGGGSVRSVAVDMSNLVMTAAEAQQAAERMMRRRVFDAQAVPLALTGQLATLEPGDVRTLMLKDVPVIARLTSASVEADGSIATEWTRDDPSVHILSGSAGAAQDGWVPPAMFIPVPTRGLVADVPLAIDAHDTAVPFLYHGAAPLIAGLWPGAEWQVSDTALPGDFTDGWASVGSADAMTWGFTTAAIPAALPWIFDRGTAINVVMGAGATLTSVAEADLLNDGALNLMLVGGEYIQFATAALESDGSYTLTSLLRGCRGTEHAIGAHIAGETMVVVDSKLFRREVGAGEIGDTDAYRATTQGGDPVASPSIAIAFTAAAQRPYAPVHGLLLLDTGLGDWTIAATRRTRIGGANVDGQDVPLGESAESWAADIMDGATVVRTLTGASLPLTYSAADQTTDWGAPQTVLNVNLYQISPALALRGFPLALAA